LSACVVQGCTFLMYGQTAFWYVVKHGWNTRTNASRRTTSSLLACDCPWLFFGPSLFSQRLLVSTFLFLFQFRLGQDELSVDHGRHSFYCGRCCVLRLFDFAVLSPSRTRSLLSTS
jgi:hypothetical protein